MNELSRWPEGWRLFAVCHITNCAFLVPNAEAHAAHEVQGYSEQIEVMMRHPPSTADQIRQIADRLYDLADRFSRSQSRPIAVTEQLIGEVEGTPMDLRIVVRGRS